MAETKKTTSSKATQVYVATRSFNEFEAGQTYEMRPADAKVWLDRDYMRPASDEQAALFGGGDAGAVHDEGTTSAGGSRPGAGS